MRMYFVALIGLLLQLGFTFAQQDTVFYDQKTGDYIFQYHIENPNTGEKDSLVRISYIPRTKLNPSVKSLVDFARDGNQFLYTYTIVNGKDSQQKLFTFLVEFGENVDLVDRSTQTWFGIRYESAGIPINKYVWVGNQGLEPTWDKNGFILSSRGLPGIGKAYFQGKSGIPSFPDGMPYEMDSILNELDKFPINYVERVIVAPFSVSYPFIPLIFLDTLFSYSSQSESLGWLKSTRDHDCDSDERPEGGVAGNLEKYLQKIRSRLSDGDTLKALRELNKFIKKVERIYKRSEDALAKGKPDDVAMTSEAYALLKYNAQYLAERLVALPPRSNGTILQQIDSLKIEIQKQGKDKKLGGSILIKSLTLLCDQARRELQKTDSSEAALNIALLQLVVDETREITEKLEEKQKKSGLLYVTADAYIALHYRTQYILDALPEPRMNLLSERKELLDPELKKQIESVNE